MNLNDLTIGQAKELACLFGAKAPACDSEPYKIGTSYLIRTVTHYYTGRLVAVHRHELVLEDAAWIADTGRYATALESGDLNEVEPIKGPVIIGRGAVIDAVVWSRALPRVQK